MNKILNKRILRDLKTNFIRLFQIRQLLREARTGITVVFGMFFCLLVFMLAFNSFILCNNIKVKNAAERQKQHYCRHLHSTKIQFERWRQIDFN